MEADLKRKSDLLSEVKVLLAQAADRERSLINEREEAKIKVLLTHSTIGWWFMVSNDNKTSVFRLQSIN